jgi:hypothetical protein
MSKTAVGLFENSVVAGHVVAALKASCFPEKEIRTVAESLDMGGSGVLSFPRVDFEVGLNRELKEIGASESEANAFVHGVRNGRVLVFATGSITEIDNAAEIMNRHGAIEVQEVIGHEPSLGALTAASSSGVADTATQTGRIRQSGGGAQMFVW